MKNKENVQSLLLTVSLLQKEKVRGNIELTPTQSRKQIAMRLQRNLQNQHFEMEHDNECGHNNLPKVTHRVSHFQLHHKYKQWAAVSTHWLHQLPIVDVDKYILICPKSASWVSITTMNRMISPAQIKFYGHLTNEQRTALLVLSTE
jgi:hypothetical protein